MLLTEEEDSPLKAIDFGLAVFFDPDKLPRTDLGLEGTPWFMAPETLSSQTYPASDIWAAGVMAYQACHSRGTVQGKKNSRSSAVWSVLIEQHFLWDSMASDVHGIKHGQGLSYTGLNIRKLT